MSGTGAYAGLDPRIWQAIIGGAFLAAGWIYNGALNRARDRRRRLEKVRDVQTALLAEIRHYVDALELFDLMTSWSRIVSAMEEDNKYVPVVPSEKNDTVFHALIEDIHVLPDPVIQPVVRYYNQVFAIDAIIEDLRSELFRKEMDQVQRVAMYTDYIGLKQQALVLGRAAISELRESLSLNSRGVARSDLR